MKILLVEDEIKLAHGMMRGLSRHGHVVDHVEDGKSALSRLSLYRDSYDIVILDLMLPELSGEEVCRQARELDITTPILVLTAKDALDSKIEVLDMGADDYMVKPFSFRELVARIRALTRRPTNEVVPTAFTIGDFSLDTGQHTIHYKGKMLSLTLKEFVLLEYFLRNPNKVLNREDVLDQLWDFEFSGFSNIVDVHVKNIRKKLGRDGSRVIQTVRGVGYRLSA